MVNQMEAKDVLEYQKANGAIIDCWLLLSQRSNTKLLIPVWTTGHKNDKTRATVQNEGQRQMEQAVSR